MPSLFDDFDKEFDVEENPSSLDPATQVARELSEEAIDDELAEAEKRLAKAAYYRVIVRDGVVEEDGTPGSREINAEARLWARRQMASLLGAPQKDDAKRQASSPASKLTEQDVAIIKKIVERTMSLGSRPPEPVVRKVESTAVLASPPAVRPAAALSSPRAARPAPKPVDPGKPRVLRPRVKEGVVDYDAIPTGETFRDPVDKNLYRFVPHPDRDGERLKMNVTHQVPASGAIPMPSREQMVSISHAQAAQSVDSGAAANTNFPDAAAGSNLGRNLFVAAAAEHLRDDK